MPDDKKPPTKAPAKAAQRDADADEGALKGDIQEQADEMNEQGYVGEAVDPVDNDEYALTSGPDSPPAVEPEADADK